MAEEIKPNPAQAAPSVISNWISILGIVLAASSFFAAGLLIAIDFFREFSNPYLGILTYIIAPLFLIAGLILILIGALWERGRRRRLKPGEIPAYPRIDFNVPRQRHAFIAIAVVTFVFLLVTALGSYRTYEFTESVTFCGETCHQIMTPEFTAHQESSHARVACVQCHVGPGATWLVKSKLSGAYRVYATLANHYPRPIPAPIDNLRPARQICEQCHWPGKYYGTAERVIEHYLSDEKNSPWSIRMLLAIGGGDGKFGPAGGIHWHHRSVEKKIEYIATDEERQVIPWVRATDSKGRETVYQSGGQPLTPQQMAGASPRVMDCMDCHNRPAHVYRSPVDSVDLAMSTGRIDKDIPDIKKQAVEALTAAYPTAAEGQGGIASKLTSYYQSQQKDFTASHPRLIDRAITEVQALYAQNFFPAMKVKWSVYADNIGHKDFPGCFRCHDGSHVSASGKIIPHDCNSCHKIIAQGSGEQLSSIDPAGLEFRHPVEIGGAWKTMTCSVCHNGALVR